MANFIILYQKQSIRQLNSLLLLIPYQIKNIYCCLINLSVTVQMTQKDKKIILPSNLQVLRQRLIDIINAKFVDLYKNNINNQQFCINDAKLEDWLQLIDQVVVQKPIIKKVRRNNQQTPQIFNNKICLEPPFQESLDPLIKIQSKAIQILRPIFKNEKQLTVLIEKAQFQQQIIKRHSSCTVLSQFSAIIIGGCRSNINPNLKSNKISQFEIKNGQISQIGQLPYGLSSHGAIYINHYIYIIGGNRDHGIISRGCFRFCLQARKIQQISCLSYPTNSMSLVNWKNSYIYKFGGIGQCFDSWGLSPYIQRYRYSIDHNYWQTINPQISPSCKTQFDHFSFMVQSFGYATQTNKIIVFGGFNLQGQAQEIGFVMKVQDQRQFQQLGQNQNGQNQNFQNHIIEKVGSVQNLSRGGFLNGQFIFSKGKNSLHLIQRSMNKQPQLLQEFIQLQIQ